MDSKLYHIVTHEAYLQNSQKLMPWVKEHTQSQSLAIIYDENIKYELHHNRVYDGRILTYRTFPVARINTKIYQKINLNKPLNLKSQILHNKFLLCLSTKPYKINKKDFKKIDSIILPISWRENYGIQKKDEAIHQWKLTQSIKNTYKLYATLYQLSPKKIDDTFSYDKEIVFNKLSKTSIKILKNNWYYTTRDKGAWALQPKTSLTIPHIKKEKNIKYDIILKYFIFNASKKHPKKMTILLNNTVLTELMIYKSYTRSSIIHIPNHLLLSKKEEVELQIKISKDSTKTTKNAYSIYLESLKIMRLKE